MKEGTETDQSVWMLLKYAWIVSLAAIVVAFLNAFPEKEQLEFLIWMGFEAIACILFFGVRPVRRGKFRKLGEALTIVSGVVLLIPSFSLPLVLFWKSAWIIFWALTCGLMSRIWMLDPFQEENSD